MSYSIEDRRRFWDRVDYRGPNGCWLWLGSRHEFGYGWFWAGGRTRNAHRVAWEMEHGAIPSGLLVMHRCDVPQCVNPDHLVLGTTADNQTDMATKGRSTKGRFRGARHPAARLVEDDVIAIRLANERGTRQADLAIRYRVSKSAVSAIVRRKRWSHVP